MTEEFDEDVVFENSPLFHYLHDLGHTDFEACPTVSQEEECGGGHGDHAPPAGDSQKPSGGRLWRVANAFWQQSPIGRASRCHKLEQQLDCVFGQYSVRCILDQDVLLQEDVELIELLDPSLLTLGSSPGGSPGRPGALPRPGLLASPSLWDVAGLVGLAAVLIGLRSASEETWSLAAAPWGLALLSWVGLRGTSLWTQGRVQRSVHARAAELQALLQNSKALTGLARKSLRLVQETEVISRGFTLVSAAGSFSRAGPGAVPRGQQLIGLRKALYRALRSAFRASRRATCHMLKAFPLNSEIDNVTNYVSAVPLKELGLGLGVEHLGDEQAQELTDDYSLPALKVLFQLWVGQSSECFRRLALLLSPRRLEEPAEGEAPAPPALHRSIAAVTEPLHHALAGCLGEVQRSYDFHRYFETQPRAQGPDKTGRAREKCRELNTLHTSIRSLQLHLKALLSEMIILEDDLEKLMVSRQPEELTCEGYRELGDRLHHLQPHMQASTGCWEDTVSQVERMLRRASSCPGNAEDPEQSVSARSHVPTPTPSYPLILDRDPVPEELEWEAYVSDSDSDDGGQGSWCDTLLPEERERQRREREESRRVLSELKAVLGFRASEGERMKWKQLLFNDQAAVTPTAREESSVAQPPSVGPLETSAPGAGAEGGGRQSEGDGRKEQEEEEEEDEVDREERGRAPPSLAESENTRELPTEFSCGLDVEEQWPGGSSPAPDAAAVGSELYQYDGLPECDSGHNGLDSFLRQRAPAVTLMERLAEAHGSEALSFSSALAAQVAARSHALVHMEEQTFGDDEEEEDDGGSRARPEED